MYNGKYTTIRVEREAINLVKAAIIGTQHNIGSYVAEAVKEKAKKGKKINA